MRPKTSANLKTTEHILSSESLAGWPAADRQSLLAPGDATDEHISAPSLPSHPHITFSTESNECVTFTLLPYFASQSQQGWKEHCLKRNYNCLKK